MVHAFVMIESGPGEATRIRDAVVEMTPMTEAHVVAGEFDVIAEADADEVYDVLHTVSTAVRSIDGVGRTKTYVSLD
ncbi:MAG: Lrp/AsnC ligand binding domain-containing protein [Halobacteriaceae archaeon]